MSETILAVFVILALAGLAIRERRKGASYTPRLEPAGRISNMDRYSQASYRYSKEMYEDLIDAAALIEQRRVGRHLGPETHVYINLGHLAAATDFEVQSHARWLDRYGASSGVILHAMDGEREMSQAEKNKILGR